MTEYIEIIGGQPLSGEVTIGGAKNAALPMLIASLLTSERCEFSNIPHIEDISLTLNLLARFGANVDYAGSTIRISAEEIIATEASYSLVKALRASFWVLAPILARTGAARVALPGGDIIGARPVDMHLEGLTKMGADLRVKHGVVYAVAPKGLKPAEISLRFPSVGATHQILMAASLVPGRTVIRGAAREPEVTALANMLVSMGAKIDGIGSSDLEIHGAEELGGVKTKLIGDRIEAGTYLLAAAACGGRVRANGISPEFFGAFLDVLSDMGLSIETEEESITVERRGTLKPVDVSTGPFPELATDLQAPLMAALTLADGKSHIEEHVFEGRFGHVAELCRMGCQIHVEERVAIIDGVKKLAGAPVEGFDIRAAASLVVAGLAAEGTTTIFETQHIRRGYEKLEEKLVGIGARIGCRISDAEDYLFAGC